MAVSYEEAIRAFHTVLFGAEARAIPADELEELSVFVDSLAQGGNQAGNPSLQALNELRTITVSPTAGEVIVPDNYSARKIRSIAGSPIDTGSFATVYRGKGEKIAYKVLRISGNNVNPAGGIIPGTYSDATLNNKLRIIFLEAWMQTVLGLDESVGPNITKINRIYRMSPVAPPYNNKNIEIIIEMQLLGLTTEGYIETSRPSLAEFSYVKLLCENLIHVLAYLRATYGFVHRDLHIKNVMFTGRNVALLDFGMSCCSFLNSKGKKVIYADPDRFDPGCWSLDMFIFFSSMFEGLGDLLTAACKLKILSFFDVTTPRGSVNLYTDVIEQVFKTGSIRAHCHGFYADTFPQVVPGAISETVEDHLAEMLKRIKAPAPAEVSESVAVASGIRRRGGAGGPSAPSVPMHPTMSNSASAATTKSKPDDSTCSCKGLLGCSCWPFSGGRRRTAKKAKKAKKNRRKSRRS